MKILFAIAAALALSVWAWGEVAASRVVFLDVGQGDAVFIEQNGYQVLVDGGDGEEISKALGRHLAPWDRTLDLVVATHTDEDHMGGVVKVLGEYEVGSVLWPGAERDDELGRAFSKALRQEGAAVLVAAAPQRIVLGDIVLEVLWPFQPIQEGTDPNDTSVVLLARAGEGSFLLTGDVTASVERRLLSFGVEADVLKVAHHGSRSSTSALFVEKVAPFAAVIQAGEDNRFGHPHREVLATLERYGIQVRRTDEEQDIVFPL